MPSAVSRRRSRSVFEKDNGAVNGNSSVPEDSDDDIKRAPPSAQDRRKKRSNINGNSNSGADFHPGAIVRVMVENFVTYEHAEFLPGPNLNMVIGPNGTGKSSLVCAICLGLGYHPKHLGRASHVGEFVKHGKDTATIEVELQKKPNERRNHVIRVQIRREDDKRKWWLNGRESTHRDVQALTRELHIQIDNLCQFLPQDKVAEFAGLTPVQLLHETLRAAAPNEMIEWQDLLIDLHKNQKKVREQVDSVAEQLQGQESRQQNMQADVDRLRERESIQKRVEDLEKAEVVAEYQTARSRFTEAKGRRKQAERRYRDLQNASEPSLRAVTRKREYQGQISSVVDHRKLLLRDAETMGHELAREVERKQDAVKNLENSLEAEQVTFKTTKTEIVKVKKAVSDLEARIRNRPPPFEASEWNSKIRNKEQQLRDNEAEKREINFQLERVQAAGSAKKEEIRGILTRLANLESQQGQQLSQLKRIAPDTYRGWEWLQENQDKFQKEVFGPPMITCSVKDERYSDLIQSLLQQDDFLCFSTQTRDDHKLLSDYFYKELKLSVSIRTCQTSLDSFKPPTSPERIQQLGLDGYAVDFLDGPPSVLAMLCGEKRIHASGVGLSNLRDDQLEELRNGEQVNSWASGKTMYRVTRRREYGPGATSTTTRQIQAGRFWTDQPPDDSEKIEEQRKKEQADAEFEELKRENTEKKSRLQELGQAESDINDEIRDLKHQKSELQRAASSFEALPAKLNNEQQKLDALDTKLSKLKDQAHQIRSEQDEAYIASTGAVLEHQQHLRTIRDAHKSVLEAQIRLIEAQSDVKGLEDQSQDVKARLEQEKELIEELKQKAEEVKAEAAKAREKLEEFVVNTEGGIEYLNGLVDGKTTEDIKNEISAEQAKLELIHGVDPAVLRQFEKRAKDIQDLSRRRDDMNSSLESLESQIKEIMEQWEPRVDELVGEINEAFSYNFEQISCAGEVGVYKDDDFEQWAIEIKVKFRENETLQQLNQHRQSGGERAVSTIFYLMALQSMAQAPFRVVDEINQGMDPRNERMVHERMVEIACREHTSQYFLITPKLLTGLRYDDRMRVLCIASGDHMPAEGKRLDFSKLVGIRRQLNAAAA